MQTFPEIDRVEFFGLEEAQIRINPAQRAFLDRLSMRVRQFANVCDSLSATGFLVVGFDEPSFSEVDIPLQEAQCLVIDLVLVPQLDHRVAFSLQCPRTR
jgi:hypothetical protein